MARAGIGAELEGVHAVGAALDAGRVETLIVEASRLGKLEGLVSRAREQGVAVEIVEELEAVTAVPQGVRAHARPIRTVSLDELTDPSPAAVVVLDHLQDPHNVGAVVRSAVAAGMTGLVVSDRRSAPLGPTAFKAAAGAFERLRVCVHPSSAGAVARLEQVGLWTIGLSADGDISIFDLDLLTEPVAVVVGGEGRGLGRLVGERCDVLAHIPMAAGVESLNASVAAALAMFEVARVRSSFS
ncbi:putative TrmH family tRNA/rRNA methyltransferase [bacterium BMS3Abin02]|nr:putative TrmH family tRNA/rRNA methyltransferase [bacterium BMS3Abin02]GBE23001.1 putative TrmH family tRNA/rRNA methyltransferase [bacterium BMS3Bbin01]